MSIVVNPLPVADASAKYTPTCEGLTAQYTNASNIISGEPLSYVWDFGDGASSSDENPLHTFNYDGNYTTTLSVTSQSACKNQFSINNTVAAQKDNVVIDLPNVITPNGDNVNDCYIFKADGDFNACSELRVYNRWGKEVFKSESSDNCWDGKDKNGNKVENGAYYYILKIKDFEKTGNISVYY